MGFKIRQIVISFKKYSLILFLLDFNYDVIRNVEKIFLFSKAKTPLYIFYLTIQKLKYYKTMGDI
jgi:hypothetical protein